MSRTNYDATSAQKQKAFEHEYLLLRKKEGRLYADDVVAKLPFVTSSDPLKKEWRIRKQSSTRLVNHLSKQNRPLRILEIGCGNGWLTNHLASIPRANVVGLDINETELAQAKRVFQRNNLQFVIGDIRNGAVNGQFDVIVFAASLQYFKPLYEIINVCFQHLNPRGEINVIDTQFYSGTTQAEAKKRSEDYFKRLASPTMQDYYFHHSVHELAAFNYKILFNPNSFFHKLFNPNPFPWICITR